VYAYTLRRALWGVHRPLEVHLTVMSMYVYTRVSVCIHSTQGSWSAPHYDVSGLFYESLGSFRMQGSFEVMSQGSFRIQGSL